jgi:transcriptional regulator with XRE-family HTH domain
MPTDNNAVSQRRRIFAENLIAARVKADMSQAQLAEKSRISQSFISYVESGKKSISIENAATLAEALRVPLCKLLHSPEK